MDSDRNIDVPFVILHRILEKLIGDVGHGVLDLIPPAADGSLSAIRRKECSHVVAEKIRRQAVIAPTRPQRGVGRRERQRQVFAFAGSFFVAAEGLAVCHY